MHPFVIQNDLRIVRLHTLNIVEKKKITCTSNIVNFSLQKPHIFCYNTLGVFFFYIIIIGRERSQNDFIIIYALVNRAKNTKHLTMMRWRWTGNWKGARCSFRFSPLKNDELSDESHLGKLFVISIIYYL